MFNKVWGQACPGKTLSYNPTGSGAGVTQFIAKQVDFAGSDSALADDQVDPRPPSAAAATRRGTCRWCSARSRWPTTSRASTSSSSTPTCWPRSSAAPITTWNDPAIAALNSGVTLPDTKITPIYRSDSSGTTDNFQKYLTAAAPQTWTKGAGKEFQGGAGEGAQKSAGVVQAVQATPGAIGYVEKGFADQAKLPFAQIDNGGGAVALTDDTAKTAIDGAKFTAEGNDLALDLNALYATKEAGAYPLMLATYEIVCSKGYDADTAAAVKSFLTVVGQPGSGRAVGRRLRAAARHVQGASAHVHRRNQLVAERTGTMSVRMNG